MKLCMRTWVYTEHRTQIFICCSTLMTYLLIATADRETCLTGIKWLLQILGDIGLGTSVKKAHICKQQVMYLGYILKEGHP